MVKTDNGHELNFVKRRAFLVTSVPVDGSTEFLPGRYIQTHTPWERTADLEFPKDSHHFARSYINFSHELILKETTHSINGFDGDLEARQDKFDELLALYPHLPKLCILSNAQHVLGEPFLIKNGFEPVCRGKNVYWHNNLLTVFIRKAA